MAFIENIFDSLGFENANAFKVTLLGNCGGYFENVSDIRSYSSEEIVLAFKKCILTVTGENLTVKKYCMGDVAVCGKITKITRS